MRSSDQPQSATSLPRAPRDDSRARFVKYLAMMAVRVACFLLMVLIQPYGWYTWIFAAGAIFLPYVAVVLANVGKDALAPRAESPERGLDAAMPSAGPVPAPAPDQPAVIRIAETPRTDGTRP